MRLISGDCIEAMRELPDESVDAIVTDPPYGLGFMGKAWDDLPPGEEWGRECLRVLKPGGHLLAFGGSRTYHRLACAVEDAGFEVRDQMQYLYGSGFPKSHNVDRVIGDNRCNCESSESHTEHDLPRMQQGDVSASEGVTGGQGSVLLKGMQEQGTPAESLQRATATEGSGESGLEGRSDLQEGEGELLRRQVRESTGLGASNGPQGRLHRGASACDGDDDGTAVGKDGSGASRRPRSGEQRSDESGALADEWQSQAGGAWPLCGRCGKQVVPHGLGTALKPAHEPIVVARKPLAGTVAENVLRFGTGALNIDGCRIGTEALPAQTAGQAKLGTFERGVMVTPERFGRWPANVVLDEEAGRLLDEQSGQLTSPATYVRGEGTRRTHAFHPGADVKDEQVVQSYGDTGGASRFFYCAKASKGERNAGLDGFEGKRIAGKGNGMARTCASCGASVLDGCDCPDRTFENPVRANHHPTVKPISLMRYLVRLVTPPEGTVLDPFLGSGTTGCAAVLEGFNFIGIEREAEYLAIAQARIEWWEKHRGDGATDEILKAAGVRDEIEAGGQLGLLEEAA